MEFLLTASPEGCAVVKVEADAAAVALCGAGDLEAEAAGFGAEGRDEAGQMHYLHAFLAENTLEVEILYVKQPAHFPGAVVPHARAAGTVSAVGDVDLVPVSPGASLRHFRAFEIHSAGAEIALDESGERTSFHEGGEHLYGHPEIGCDAGHVGFSAGGIEMQHVAALHRLAVFGGHPQTHAGGHQEGIFAILLKFHILLSCYLDTLPEPSPFIRFSTSATVTRL